MLLYALFISFPVRHTANFRFDGRHCIGHRKVPVYERLNSFRVMFSFSTLSHDEPYHLLDSIAFQCIRICSILCAFPVREKVEISTINAYAYFCG